MTGYARRFLLAGNVPKCRSVCHALSGSAKGRKSVSQRPPGRLVPIPPAIAPFHRIGIDLLGRFPKVCSWKQMDSLHGLLGTICNNNKSLADSRSRRNSEVFT
ncbi:hypothetical protein TNCV_2017591 [Trichonephila clavipes]|nr:hypothetical protein TNCV_2017591 [Trichonephila clavipes]